MISIFKQERDPQGREVVQIGMNPMLFQVAAIGGPLALIGTAYFTVGQSPIGMPWFLVAGPIAIGVIGYAAVSWMSRRSNVRITIDAKAGKLLVGTSSGQAEIRMVDVAKAEFGSSSAGEGPTVYRLEFVMRSGERVPATAAYFNAYALGDQAKTVGAINGSLGARSA